MDVAQIVKLLKENRINMEIVINESTVRAFFWSSEVGNGIFAYGADDIGNALLSIPTLKERIVQENHKAAINKAIELIEGEGLHVTGGIDRGLDAS